MARPVSSWAEFGERLAQARKVIGLTQADLSRELGLDRTAISKIESGQRSVDTLELGRIAQALKRPVEWFVSLPPPSIASRRAARVETGELTADIFLEDFARDVELLVELNELSPAEPRWPGFPVNTVEDAERAAKVVRAFLGQPEGPLRDLLRIMDRLGLYAASFDLKDDKLDGSYVAIEKGGVAVINGGTPSGRRRFTLAHELGHHVLADSYSAEWLVHDEAETRESLISAFAVHFLLPRQSITKVWEEQRGRTQPRLAAIAIGSDYGVSWTAVCAQLKNLGLIDEPLRQELVRDRPRKADYLEMEIAVPEDLRPTAMSPAYSAAVIKAYRKHKIGATRAIELLHKTIRTEDLPETHEVPLDSMHDELKPRRR